MAGRAHGDRGSFALELAVVAPALLLIIAFIVSVGRVTEARAQVQGAARDVAHRIKSRDGRCLKRGGRHEATRIELQTELRKPEPVHVRATPDGPKDGVELGQAAPVRALRRKRSGHAAERGAAEVRRLVFANPGVMSRCFSCTYTPLATRSAS